MKYRKGDLFITDAPAIGHGVNTQGVMGAGIAKQFRDRFPNNYKVYRKLCLDGSLFGGGIFIYFENGKEVVNIASQERTGANADYGFLFAGCYSAAVALTGGIETLAIPKIGCGIGGIEWDKVEKCLKTIEELVPGFEFEVWEL